jgi:hypothetical protein
MLFPANKKKILKESITRLLQLGIPEADIVQNLQSVGVQESLAKSILRETKEELAGKQSKQSAKAASEIKKLVASDEKQVEDKPVSKSSSESGDSGNVQSEEELIDEFYDEENKEDDSGSSDYLNEIKKSIVEDKVEEDSGVGKKNYSLETEAPVSKEASDVSSLWEKGILATVDAKLTEMERIRDELDKVLDQKISEKMKVEIKKVEAVLESERALFYNKIDSHLESKAEELKNVIAAQSKQLQDVNAKAADILSKIQVEKKFNAELLNSLNEKIASIETLRSQMLSQLNQAQMEQGLKFKTFMDESAKRREELEARISRALQLESKIAEGLIEDAKNRIETMRLDKDAELSKKINDKVKEIDDIIAKLDPKGVVESAKRIKVLDEQITKKISEIDALLEKKFSDVDRKIEESISEMQSALEKAEDERFAELKEEYSQAMDEMFSQELEIWDKKIKSKEEEIEKLKEQIDVEKFNAALESLDLFKDQFVNTISKSIDDYNKAKKELAEKVIARDKAINDYLKRIDSKLAELSEFQQKLSKEFAATLDKLESSTDTSAEKKSKK